MKDFPLQNNSKQLCHNRRTYFSSALETLVLVFTSHNFTVQSADPDAITEPSELIHPTIINKI